MTEAQSEQLHDEEAWCCERRQAGPVGIPTSVAARATHADGVDGCGCRGNV
jgi:hypothetical protein